MDTSTLLPHKIHPPTRCCSILITPSFGESDWAAGVTEGQTSYLGPFGVDKTCFDCIVQRGAVLAQSEIGCGAVTVQDTVLGVSGQGLAVETHSQSILPLLAGLVTATHALQEFRFAQAARAGWTIPPLHSLGWRDYRRGRRGWRGSIGGGPAGGARTKKRELRSRRGRGDKERMGISYSFLIRAKTMILWVNQQKTILID